MTDKLNLFLELENAVLPQMFLYKQGEVLFFDKINKHEGRFYRIYNKVKTFYEIDDSIGIISKDGDMFSIKLGNTTIIKELDEGGSTIREFVLEGAFYDLCKDNNGNYIFIGLENNNKFVIEIYKDKGLRISQLYPKDIILGCGINTINDHIFLGVVDDNNKLSLIEMNYLGLINNQWRISDLLSEQVIDKITFYGDYIVLLLKGSFSSIILLDKNTGSHSTFMPWHLGIQDFSDINIYNDMIYILDKRKIYSTEIVRLVKGSIKGKTKIERINANTFAYQFMMYAMEMGNNLNYFSKFASIAFIFFAFISYCFFMGQINLINTKHSIIGFTLAVVLAANLKTFIGLSDRRERVEKLLEINMCRSNNWVSYAVYNGVFLFNICLYQFPLNSKSIIFSLLTSFGISYGAFFRCSLIIQKYNDDIIIELLHDDNSEFSNYVECVISNMKYDNNEKLYINIFSDDEALKNIIQQWIKTRGNIIRQDVVTCFSENSVTTMLDFSKRDIKYSKYSILMDYICFLKGKIQVKEIQINSINED